MNIEERLGRLFGYDHAVLFGRARSAMVALFEALGAERAGEVVIPSNICPAVLAGVVTADAKPRLAPVAPDSGLATDRLLAAAMKQAPRAGVAMPTHLYGMRADYPETRKLAAAQGWFVLENDTLATTAAPDGKRLAIGDALLLSFGAAKTIEAGGGGAILTDDSRLADELARRASAWPAPGEEAEAAESHLTLVRRHLRALGRPELAEPLLPLDLRHCRHGFPESLRAPLAKALDHLPRLLEQRREGLRRWDSALARLGDVLLAPPLAPAVPWRVIRRFRDPMQRDPVVGALRRSGFDAGTNYPPLSDGFPALLDGQVDDESDAWGDAVINLWINEEYDVARIDAVVGVIAATLSERERSLT